MTAFLLCMSGIAGILVIVYRDTCRSKGTRVPTRGDVK
jgi:hypothetical protein